MAKSSRVAWFAEDQVLTAVRLEPALVLLVFSICAWLAYKIFLRAVSHDRHLLFRQEFRSLSFHVVVGSAMFGVYEFLKIAVDEFGLYESVVPYFGLLVIASASIVLVKIIRIIAFEYLFLLHMKVGVPALLVNILTLIMSIVIGGWYLTHFFSVDLTPLLATSAIFSIVLGLAMQDTLGNLFAAISLQIDKPFELGDWIEVRGSFEKIAGQVQEVTWRATVLLAITDELITIPNRLMAQSQIMNFSGRRPFFRSHTFRIPYDAPLDTAKIVLLSSISSVPGVSRHPRPVVFVSETTESWVQLRVSYTISDYGSQWGIADKFLTRALADLAEAGVPLAAPRLEVDAEIASESSQPKASA